MWDVVDDVDVEDDRLGAQALGSCGWLGYPRAMRAACQALLALLSAICLLCTVPGCEVSDLLDDDSASSEPTPEDIAKAALASKPVRTFEAIGQGVICPGSFGRFKRKITASSKNPGSGFQWHHIVNQNPKNMKRFGNRLHCTDNLISLPTAIHRKVSGHYSGKPNWTNGKLVRDVINERSWTKQYEYGLDVLRRHGVKP